MNSDIKKILVLGPHTDDGEFGCGGTMARFIADGREVYYAAFSIAEASVPEGFPKDVLDREIRHAAAVMGMPENRLTVFRYPVRKFPAHRQEILEDLILLRKKISPDLVLLPASTDVHQDHQVIHQEGVRAFKFFRIWGYELPWNNFSMTTDTFVRIDEAHLAVKIAAIQCYESQQAAGRSYADDEFIRGWARTRGVQIGMEYAEAFQMIRWIFS